uniref:Hok/gef family n=1 Tax=CrAss-like virus sp. ctelJ1 TaxID=2825838 RepID=A0A8S5V2H9_9CAUD|nr:MAG TPA: Hok/gef family [CrAss-like virus sp. ctelJ1]
MVVTCCLSIIKIVAMMHDCRNSLCQLRFFDYLCRIV